MENAANIYPCCSYSIACGMRIVRSNTYSLDRNLNDESGKKSQIAGKKHLRVYNKKVFDLI